MILDRGISQRAKNNTCQNDAEQLYYSRHINGVTDRREESKAQRV